MAGVAKRRGKRSGKRHGIKTTVPKMRNDHKNESISELCNRIIAIRVKKDEAALTPLSRIPCADHGTALGTANPTSPIEVERNCWAPQFLPNILPTVTIPTPVPVQLAHINSQQALAQSIIAATDMSSSRDTSQAKSDMPRQDDLPELPAHPDTIGRYPSKSDIASRTSTIAESLVPPQVLGHLLPTYVQETATETAREDLSSTQAASVSPPQVQYTSAQKGKSACLPPVAVTLPEPSYALTQANMRREESHFGIFAMDPSRGASPVPELVSPSSSEELSVTPFDSPRGNRAPAPLPTLSFPSAWNNAVPSLAPLPATSFPSAWNNAFPSLSPQPVPSLPFVWNNALLSSSGNQPAPHPMADLQQDSVPDRDRREWKYEIDNGVKRQAPTPQNWRGPFFTGHKATVRVDRRTPWHKTVGSLFNQRTQSPDTKPPQVVEAKPLQPAPDPQPTTNPRNTIRYIWSTGMPSSGRLSPPVSGPSTSYGPSTQLTAAPSDWHPTSTAVPHLDSSRDAGPVLAPAYNVGPVIPTDPPAVSDQAMQLTINATQALMNIATARQSSQPSSNSSASSIRLLTPPENDAEDTWVMVEHPGPDVALSAQEESDGWASGSDLITPAPRQFMQYGGPESVVRTPMPVLTAGLRRKRSSC